MSRRRLPSFHIPAFHIPVSGMTVFAAGLLAVPAPLPAQQTAPAATTLANEEHPAPLAHHGFSPVLASQTAQPPQQPAAASTPAAVSSAPASATPGTPAASPATAAPAASSAALKSMLDEPAAPATIDVTGGQLSIKATNASLSDVLRQVASRTGMQIEGNSHDQRVYGIYGPGLPDDVLSALLYDSGYNVLMVGSTVDGAPRRLVLSPRTAINPTQVANSQPVHNDDDDETPVEPPPPPPQPTQPQGTSTTNPGQVKTPQQMLQELQRLTRPQQDQGNPQ